MARQPANDTPQSTPVITARLLQCCHCHADISITDADVAILVTRSVFVTIADTQYYNTPGRPSTDRDWSGHHGIWLKGTADVLVEKFNFQTRYVHDLSVDKFAMGSVFHDGKGIDVNMDHHKAQNGGSLWTSIDMGRCILLCRCGDFIPPLPILTLSIACSCSCSVSHAQPHCKPPVNGAVACT
jgi:hypothetical protein